MSNNVMLYAVFNNDKCANIIRATPSVIEEFSQSYSKMSYILASTYGLEVGDCLLIGDFREKQADGSYKYFRNEIVGADEQRKFIYEPKELIYLGE